MTGPMAATMATAEKIFPTSFGPTHLVNRARATEY